MTTIFENRSDAGSRLALLLSEYASAHPVVLALPRGGVEVGREVARFLGADFDVFVVRKLGAPGDPELGIGAVAEGGVTIVDRSTVLRLHISKQDIASIRKAEQEEIKRRILRYRGKRPFVSILGRTTIIVDDGIATGMTARASIAAIRKLGPSQIILAVPVCPTETALRIRRYVDRLVYVYAEKELRAVGEFYTDFSQVSDEKVVRILSSF
ncbi:MAG: phosphoribosyltransferase [bacterium]|nr:phosphoribosyltransferase [bacterium]